MCLTFLFPPRNTVKNVGVGTGDPRSVVQRSFFVSRNGKGACYPKKSNIVNLG